MCCTVARGDEYQKTLKIRDAIDMSAVTMRGSLAMWRLMHNQHIAIIVARKESLGPPVSLGFPSFMNIRRHTATDMVPRVLQPQG